MRDYEKLVVGALLVVPLVVAGLGWPLFVHWIGGSGPSPQPEVAGAAATSVATARAERTPRPPTPGLPATPNPAADARAAAPQPDRQTDDPGAAVASFYQMVGAHDFGGAAQLWSPRMRAAYPPDQNIAQRFSQTRQVALNRAEVVTMSGSQATVAVDLVEVTAANQHHYTGTWSVVRSGTGWLLDQPDLQSAP